MASSQQAKLHRQLGSLLLLFRVSCIGVGCEKNSGPPKLALGEVSGLGFGCSLSVTLRDELPCELTSDRWRGAVSCVFVCWKARCAGYSVYRIEAQLSNDPLDSLSRMRDGPRPVCCVRAKITKITKNAFPGPSTSLMASHRSFHAMFFATAAVAPAQHRGLPASVTRMFCQALLMICFSPFSSCPMRWPRVQAAST